MSLSQALNQFAQNLGRYLLLIADMACYLAYYHLPPMPAFIDGTTPLIAVTVFSEIVVTMIV